MTATTEKPQDEKESNLILHAKRELDLIGMTENSEDMNGMMREHILKMMQVFADEGHSGFSASYAANALSKLMKYEVLSPLTGKEDEWVEVGHDLFQNKRASNVFRDSEGAYQSDYTIFYDWVQDKEDGTWHKTHYTSGDSRKKIDSFPYTPVHIYQERVGDPEE